jgi:hypothetical protein
VGLPAVILFVLVLGLLQRDAKVPKDCVIHGVPTRSLGTAGPRLRHRTCPNKSQSLPIQSSGLPRALLNVGAHIHVPPLRKAASYSFIIRVATVVLAIFPGRIVRAEQLEQMGLLAAREPERAAPAGVSTPRSWPVYQRCVEGAPMKHGENTPDISRADFMWSLMAAQRGHGRDAIADRLMELSSKAEENGERYARLTAENAVAAVERQRGRQRA